MWHILCDRILFLCSDGGRGERLALLCRCFFLVSVCSVSSSCLSPLHFTPLHSVLSHFTPLHFISFHFTLPLSAPLFSFSFHAYPLHHPPSHSLSFSSATTFCFFQLFWSFNVTSLHPVQIQSIAVLPVLKKKRWVAWFFCRIECQNGRTAKVCLQGTFLSYINLFFALCFEIFQK